MSSPPRNPCISILGRLACLEPVPRWLTARPRDDPHPPPVSRIPHKSREILFDSFKPLHMAGNRLGHGKRHVEGSNGKGNLLIPSGGELNQEQPSLTQRLGTIRGPRGICLPSSTPHEALLPPVSLSPRNCTGKQTRLDCSHPGSSTHGPTSLDIPNTDIPAKPIHSHLTTGHNLDGRLEVRMGNYLISRTDSTRNLVNPRKNQAHQPIGDPSHPKRHQNSRSQTLSPKSDDRQRDGQVRSTQNGKQIGDGPQNSVDGPGRANSEKHPHEREPHPIVPKRRCRRPKPEPPSSHGMVLRRERVRGTTEMARPHGGGPHGYATESETTGIRVSISPPRGSGDRRTINRLEQLAPNLSLSTKELPSSRPNETPNLSLPRDTDNPSSSVRSVVSNHTTEEPKITTAITTSVSNSSGQTRTIQLRSMDRLEFLKTMWEEKHGEIVANRLILAQRDSTARQFQSAWKTFQAWLPTNIPDISKQNILEFLLFLQDERKLKPRTILVYRAALALPLVLAYNIDTSDKEFSLLAKAQFLSQPPTTPKLPSWSLNRALETLSNHPFKPPTSLENLFLKTIFLVALASGNRVSELAACVRTGSVISLNHINLAVRSGFLFKNQSILKKPSAITFPAIDLKHPLCPGACLQLYLKETAHTDHKGYLFVHPSTGLPLKSGRLAYWLWKAIQLSARPVETFGAHDLRKLGHSVAWIRGTPLDEILKNGSWQSPNVFINNYCTSLIVPSKDFVAGRSLIKN